MPTEASAFALMDNCIAFHDHPRIKTMLTAFLCCMTRLAMIAIGASFFLNTGQAHAENVAFTADGLFSTDVISYFFLVESKGLDGVELELPGNTSIPEFFKLSTGGETFDATLIDSMPGEILTYDFTRSLVSTLDIEGSSYAAEVHFAKSTLTARPTQVTAPEMDPASTASSLFLLAGGLAVARGRRTAVLQTTSA